MSRPKRKCISDECSENVAGQGKYCYSHSPRRERDVPLSQRILSRVQQRKPDECWPWTGYVNCHGYGVLRYGNQNLAAHRSVYEILVGPIPEAKVLDHVCYNTQCVNPNHLRPVDPKHNVENFSTPLRKNNTSGYRGAQFHRTSGLWAAVVTHQMVKHHGGYYKTAEEAGAAAHALRLALHSHNELDRAS